MSTCQTIPTNQEDKRRYQRSQGERILKSVRLILVAVTSLVAATTHAIQLLPPASRTAAIDKVLSEAVRQGDIPGVVAIATDRRGVIYKGAFGLAETATSRKLELDSIFRIASMTKPITSVAAMLLVEEGRLHLDDRWKSIYPNLLI